jgi:hypothetical protein
MLGNLLTGGKVPVEPTALIFEVKVLYVMPYSVVNTYHRLHPEDGSRSFLRNFGTYLSRHNTR